MSVMSRVTNPVGRVGASVDVASRRADCSWPMMNPTGTIRYFFAAFSSRRRARSRASLSKTTWLNRASAFRTWALSCISGRRRPREST